MDEKDNDEIKYRYAKLIDDVCLVFRCFSNQLRMKEEKIELNFRRRRKLCFLLPMPRREVNNSDKVNHRGRKSIKEKSSILIEMLD